MNCIDFHTHAFPDTIAKRAISVLMESTNSVYLPVTDGTVAGLVKKMDESDVDISLVLPVITKPSQTKGTNEWAAAIVSEKIRSFGGIHPHTDDYKRDIDFVVSLGLPGIKLHAEYQDFTLDSPEMLKIYDYAFSRGLMIIHHAGYDPAYKPPFRSNPKMFENVINEMKGGVLIAAHLGGHAQWDDVERYMVGREIYLETSMGLGFCSDEQFLRIVKNHSSKKILIGSDSPWSDIKTAKNHLSSIIHSQQEKENILYKNAQKLLKI